MDAPAENGDAADDLTNPGRDDVDNLEGSTSEGICAAPVADIADAPAFANRCDEMVARENRCDEIMEQIFGEGFLERNREYQREFAAKRAHWDERAAQKKARRERGLMNQPHSRSSEDTMLSIADFIAPTVVQFLGVRSLVRFGDTCSLHGAVVSREVQRRRGVIAATEAEVARLVASADSAEPTRENITTALELVDQGRRLIDDEIELHEKICTNELRCDDGDGHQPVDEDGYDWRDFDLFFEERMKFLPGAISRESGSLYILPLCFYLPPEGESRNPSAEAVEETCYMAHRVWRAEDMMGSVYDLNYCKDNWDNWDRMNYKQPLWQFTLPGAGLFTGFVEEIACDLAGHGKIDAFRIAARKLYFKCPRSRDCLWYTLDRADKLEALFKSEEDKNLEEVSD